MVGQVRVTVVATGFERAAAQTGRGVQGRGVQGRAGATPVIPITEAGVRPRPVIGGSYQGGSAMPAPRARPAAEPRRIEDLSDMEIPTFIRRQMD